MQWTCRRGRTRDGYTKRRYWEHSILSTDPYSAVHSPMWNVCMTQNVREFEKLVLLYFCEVPSECRIPLNLTSIYFKVVSHISLTSNSTTEKVWEHPCQGSLTNPDFFPKENLVLRSRMEPNIIITLVLHLKDDSIKTRRMIIGTANLPFVPRDPVLGC